MAPKTFVSKKATNKVLLWVCSFVDTAPTSTIVSALQWLTGLLDFGLTNQDNLDGFYEFFFAFLQRPKLEMYVSQLIYILTKPEDISRWRVMNVMKVHGKNKHQKHTTALLCQFKSFRPELVPEPVPTINIRSAFRNIPEMMRNGFHKAQLRKGIMGGETGDCVADISWGAVNDEIRKPGAAKRSKMDLIPAVDYIQFSSNIYREKAACSILQFKTIESLGCYQLSLDIPCQVISLLANNAGYHVLAFGDVRLQERLSFVLYHQLHAVFIKRSVPISHLMKKTLLVKVIALETYMQQGIPVVSRMLNEFMHMWNGYDFKLQIFKLLEWITFDSFHELNAIILEHMHRFFVQSDIEGKCLIIATMKRLLGNLFLEVYRRKNGFPLLFMRDTPQWDSMETLVSLTKFVQNLCSLGLIIESDSVLLMHESLSFYEMLSHLENQSDLPLWTIMTPSIFYRGLFTSNATVMSRVCALMLRYKNIDNKRLKVMGIRRDFTYELDMIKMYSTDLYNCLWHGTALSNREEGFIFKDISNRDRKNISAIVRIDTAFLYCNHFAFASMTNIKDRINWLLFMQKYMPELVELLKACTDDSPNHQ